MAISDSFANVLFGSFVIAIILFGVGIGLALGAGMDAKARKEGKVI